MIIFLNNEQYQALQPLLEPQKDLDISTTTIEHCRMRFLDQFRVSNSTFLPVGIEHQRDKFKDEQP